MRHYAMIASLVLAATPVVASAEPVLLISIDGLRPLDVIDAEKRGLKLPNLRRFLKEGSYARGVVGVLPTLTYPSHATLITGAAPARHGIVSNTTFDPIQMNHDGWFWYASDYNRETLWDVAGKAGLRTANIHWPISVGARSLTYSLPQIWRTGHADDAKLIDALATPGLKAKLEREVGQPYAAGIDESIAADENRARFAAQLIADEKPDFMTVYFASLDHEEHAFGPGSPEANAILERIDVLVGTLVAAQLAARPDGAIAVVSDHGFEPIDNALNLYGAFIEAGLITVGADAKIATWEAVPWASGGSAAIMLARPEDEALSARVLGVLEKLRADPANGIDRIVGRSEIAAMGGNPQARFYVNLKPGTATGGFYGADLPLRITPPYKGMHGYFPSSSPNLHATFLLMGQNVVKGRDLGVIDMRAIAPTLAGLLGTSLPQAEAKPLAVKASK